jgi:hypothetical protein
MSIPTISTAPYPTVSPEVLAFAREQGVEQYVTPLIDLTRRIYPTATRFDVFLEDDPEIANDRHIILELDVPIGLKEAREADWKWHTGAFEIVPAPLICVFRRSADLRP